MNCSRTRYRRLQVASVLLAAGLGACKDTGQDPLAVLINEGARNVLAVEARLPSPPKLAAEADAESQLEIALERWSSSWERSHDEGRELRAQAYGEVAQPLVTSLGRESVSEGLRSVQEAVAAADALGSQALSGVIGENLQEAKALYSAGMQALELGQEAAALTHTLRAADLLREIGPEGVSRLLIARAESGMSRRTQARGTREAPESETRALRLIRGARIALDSGDYVLAIERAFYACQLVGVDPMAP